jgi:hypothetical protein
MPFTATHTLAIMPLAFWKPRLLPPSALAIGSMVPDLPLFFPIGIDYWTLHEFPGVITLCVPLGLIILFLYHTYIRQVLVMLSPLWIRTRLQVLEDHREPWNIRWLAGAMIALAIGALTHIFWDGFTHAGRWGTELFPALNDPVTIAGLERPLYKVLQYGSSAIGLPLIALICFIWLTRQPSHLPPLRLRRVPAVAATIAIIIIPAIAGFLEDLFFYYDGRFRVIAFYFVTRSIASCCVLLLLFGIGLSLFHERLLEKTV